MTDHVARWQRVESILAAGHRPLSKIAYVTSREWGEIAKELEGYDMIDPSRPTIRPNPMNFKQMRIGKCLLLRNSGTEDQDVCDMLNMRELGEEDKKIYDFRKLNFQTGKIS